MWSGCARRSTASTFSSTRCRPRRGGTIVAPARRWLLRAPSAVWRPSGSRVHTTPSGRSRATDRCFSGRRGEGPRGTRARGRRRRDRRRRRRQSGQARPVPPRDVSLDTRPAGRIGARAAARRSHERRLRRGSRGAPWSMPGSRRMSARSSRFSTRSSGLRNDPAQLPVEHAVVEKVFDPPQADEPVTVEVLARQSSCAVRVGELDRPAPRRPLERQIGERPLEPSRSPRGNSAGPAPAPSANVTSHPGITSRTTSARSRIR